MDNLGMMNLPRSREELYKASGMMNIPIPIINLNAEFDGKMVKLKKLNDWYLGVSLQDGTPMLNIGRTF